MFQGYALFRKIAEIFMSWIHFVTNLLIIEAMGDAMMITM
jgi:hypothetical protein